MGVERVEDPSRVQGRARRSPLVPSGVQLCDHIQPEIIPHHPQDDADSHCIAGKVDYARREATGVFDPFFLRLS